MPQIRRPSIRTVSRTLKGEEELSFLSDHSNPLGDIGPVHLLHGNKFKKNLSLLGFKKMIEDFRRVVFPDPFGPDHTNKLSLLDSKRDVLEHPIFMIPERDGIDSIIMF